VRPTSRSRLINKRLLLLAEPKRKRERERESTRRAYGGSRFIHSTLSIATLLTRSPSRTFPRFLRILIAGRVRIRPEANSVRPCEHASPARTHCVSPIDVPRTVTRSKEKSEVRSIANQPDLDSVAVPAAHALSFSLSTTLISLSFSLSLSLSLSLYLSIYLAIYLSVCFRPARWQ